MCGFLLTAVNKKPLLIEVISILTRSEHIMYTSKQIKKQLTSAIARVTSNPESFCKNPNKDFSRKRKLPLKKVMQSILSLSGKDLKCEIMDIFNFSVDSPSVSAFVQQRSKLSWVAFETIFKEFTKSVSTFNLYKGYRLIAVDGSDLHTPTNKNEIDSFYPGTNGQKPYNLMHLNALYDLKQRIYVDAITQDSHKRNEHKAFVTMVDRDVSNVPTVYIADRGYESYNNLAHIQEKGQYFLIRIKDITGNGIASRFSPPKEDEFDITFDISLTRKQTNAVKNNPSLSFLPHNVTFDYLPKKCRKSIEIVPYVIHYRMVRIKLSKDKFEVLLTNLPKDKFPPEELKKLYSMRWGIETSFRSLKYSLALNYFHSKKTENIRQEIFAKLTMYNFTELIISQITIRKKQRKYTYKANFSAAVHICAKFFSKNISPSVVEALISKHLTSIKPTSSNPRKLSSKSSVSFLYRVA